MCQKVTHVYLPHRLACTIVTCSAWSLYTCKSCRTGQSRTGAFWPFFSQERLILHPFEHIQRSLVIVVVDPCKRTLDPPKRKEGWVSSDHDLCRAEEIAHTSDEIPLALTTGTRPSSSQRWGTTKRGIQRGRPLFFKLPGRLGPTEGNIYPSIGNACMLPAHHVHTCLNPAHALQAQPSLLVLVNY